MKQRLGIALSLINDPELLIWDEPMNGLDPLGRKLIKELMIELRKKGKTLFFSTHILSDVQQVADQFAIINNGSILLKSNMGDINEDLEDFFVSTIHSQEQEITIK
jgi:ABC-2 type transport system ATP-binding protein